MTLSTLAYVEENRIATREQMIEEINDGLRAAQYPSWKVVWGPALNADRSNMMYAAGNSETGAVAVSIRGSDFSFWLNWIEDLASLTLVPFNEFVPAAGSTAQIARGTAIGLRQLLGMRDETRSLEAFLTAAPRGTPLLVTGHSLGGCLASALAPCIANWVGGARPFGSSTAWTSSPTPGPALARSKPTTRLCCPVPPTSRPSSTMPNEPWAENIVNSGIPRRAAQSNCRVRWSSRSFRNDAVSNSIRSRMRCFCGRRISNTLARPTRRCVRSRRRAARGRGWRRLLDDHAADSGARGYGMAASSTALARRIRSSRKCVAISCTACGRPAASRPHGQDAAGSLVALNTHV